MKQTHNFREQVYLAVVSFSVVVDSLFNVPSIGLWGLCVWSLFC